MNHTGCSYPIVAGLGRSFSFLPIEQSAELPAGHRDSGRVSRTSFVPPHSTMAAAMLIFLCALFPGANNLQAQVNAYRQGMLHRAMGHSERAEEYFNQSIQQTEEEADQARLALLEMRMGRDGTEAQFQDLLDGATEEGRPQLYRSAGFLLMDHGASERALQLLLSYPDRFPDDPTADAVLYSCGRYASDHGFGFVAATLLYDLLDRYPNSELADDAYIMLARHYYRPGPDYNPDRSRDIFLHFVADDRPAFRSSPHLHSVQMYLMGRTTLGELFSSMNFPVL